MSNPVLRRLLVASLMLGLSACSWFDDDEEVNKDPFPLQSIKTEVSLQTLWSRRVGSTDEDKYQRFVPAIDGDRLYAVGSDGKVVALTLDKGKTIWEANVLSILDSQRDTGFFGSSGSSEELVSGGVGAGHDLVLLATNTGYLVALHQSDGSLAWQIRASSEILSPPQINDSIVVAQSVDGVLSGYDPDDGTRKWTFSTSSPKLTLRGTSTPILLADAVIAGFANGRVVMLDIARGLPQWEQKVAIGQGESELERLIDIDGQMVMETGRLFVASYQGQLVALDIASGKIGWQLPASSFVGVGGGFGNVYLAADNSVLTAFDMASSKEIWSIDALTYRDITAPASSGNYIAVGDLEGYVHLIAQSDGRFVGRKKVDGDGIRSTIVTKAGTLYVMGNGGKLSALRIR
jgi:outer membrane protein assembly factor BamB